MLAGMRPDRLSSLQRTVINGVLFNAVWLVCVLGGNAIAPIAAAALLLFHLMVISRNPSQEIKLIASNST